MSDQWDSFRANGGPAFPIAASAPLFGCVRAFSGMSLRDYFAAQVMQGLVSNAIYNDSSDGPGGQHITWLIATSSYRVADAMLKARESK